ncbi:hypothetical protein [Microcoleus sp. PH2017_05_CCC_O_A]|uniref:hypothetical protein n=1 Tax=Microcoleus sp. PH2017_05_CCC_O_A TaxID=2798816 RepID=UPI001E02DE55|nr:hypothetical protein [Microcoleus sp. PH2017_05_CCC_O_A]MCC3436919.1 hypothetical protein [Microcoleus sp. PH2017_05_CCC_O_A]
MSLFRKTVSIRCSGDKNNECPNYKNKTPLEAHKRHCPVDNCGSSVTEDTKPNVLGISAVLVSVVAVLGVIGYLLWQKQITKVTEPLTPKVPVLTPTPSVKANPKSPETPARDSSVSAKPTPTSTSIPPITTSTPTPTPVSPVRLPPPPPSKQDIETAILKLKNMNPNELLEFPVEEAPDSYRVIAMKDSTGIEWRLTVQTVQDFLQESVQQGGKFSEKNKQLSLVVRNQSTGEEKPDVPIDKNELLARFVRSISVMK